MELTNISIKKIENEGNLKGYATIVLDDCLVIHNLKIIESQDKLFIAFPSQKGNDNKYYDICHPITQEFRNLITDEILKQYYK